MKRVRERKVQLEGRLAELQAKLRDIEGALDQPGPKDDEDRATFREDDEVMERMGLKGEQEIEMIHAALARIEAGEYGNCVKCGLPISEERLNLLPATPFCRLCAM